MLKFLILLLAGFALWRAFLRPWLFGRKSEQSEPDPRFQGEEVRDADFEEFDDSEEKRKRS